jgi:hypothetical protein
MTGQLWDLVELGAELEKRGRHGELRRAIRRALDVASAHQDLTDAADALSLLHRFTRGEHVHGLSDGDVATAVGALQSNSIVLYARATDTTPIGRQKWFGRSKLSAEHQTCHDEMMQLRNKEIAHFGRGKLIDGSPLLTETIVLNPSDPQYPYGYLTRRSQNRAGLARRLVDLVAAVQVQARDAFNARLTELHSELKKALAADPSVGAWLQEHPLHDAGLLAAQGITEAGAIDYGMGRFFSGVAVEPVLDPE